MKLGLCDMGVSMKVKCSVYIAASVDGFIAKPDGDIDWLLRPEYVATDMKGLRYDQFISTVDAVVMGRHSFDKALSFSSWFYEGTLVIVLSSNQLVVPDHLKRQSQSSGRHTSNNCLAACIRRKKPLVHRRRHHDSAVS